MFLDESKYRAWEYSGYRMMRMAPPLPLRKISTPQISLHACKGMIKTYKRISADDLCGMIRQENRFLVLIGDHEVGDVVPRISTVHWVD